MSNKIKTKFRVRLTCIILAGLMVLGVATTTIFVIIDLLSDDNKKTVSISAPIELSVVDGDWRL